MNIPNLFSITWTPLNVTFIAVFAALVYVGFKFIFRDMKAIKQSRVTRLDYFFAIFFGVMFAASILLGTLVLMAYGSRVELDYMPPPVPITMPRFTTAMFVFLMGVTIAYPFVEFMFLSFGAKQTSPMFYQDFLFKRVISRSSNKVVRVLLSTGFYVLIFVAVPAALSAAGFPLFMGLVTMFQLFPIWLLSRLGAEGHFYGLNLNFYNIFERDRFMYAVFDDRKKAEAQLKETPIPILAVPIMVYVYLNGFISIVQLVTNPFGADTTFNFTFLVSTFTNILTALIGFYNKFWRREIKYKVQDTLFAGYLFANLSVNILLTFLVKEPGVMVASLGVLFDTELTLANYWMLIPAAMIQRVVFVWMVTYYFVKGGEFKQNVLDSLMVLSRNRLVPRILFNFSRHPQARVRAEAARLLDEMYRVYSLKYVPPPGVEDKPGLLKRITRGIAALVTPPKRRQAPFDYVFDAFGSEHVQVRIAASKVVGYLFSDDPDQAIAKLRTHLADLDDVKVSCLLDVMSRLDPSTVTRVDANLLLDRVEGACASVRASAFGLLGAYSSAIETNPNLRGRVVNLVNASLANPSPAIQSACLGFLGSSDSGAAIAGQLAISTIVAKINHPNTQVKQGAVALLDGLIESAVGPEQVSLVVKLLDDRNPGVQRAALAALHAMSARVRLNVSPEKLSELTASSDKAVSLAAAKLLARLAEQMPGEFELRPILALLDSGDAQMVDGILQDLGETIEKNPSAFLPILGRIIERPEIALKEIAKKRLVAFGGTHFDEVLDHILNIKEDARFAVRNFTREILLEVGKLVPDKLIPVLQAILVPEKARKNFGSLIPFLDAGVASKIERVNSETFRVNAASVLGDLAESFPGKVNLKALLEAAKKEESWRVRRDLVTSIGKMVSRANDVPVTDYLALFDDENANVRVAVAKGLLAVAKARASAVPIDLIASRMGDPDGAVRESLVAVAGQLGTSGSEDVMPLLVRGLEDEKWPVKNAAADAMGKMAESTPDRIPVDALKHVMFNDKDKWARWQAAHTLGHVVKSKPGALSLKEVAGKIDTGDENMARAYLELLQAISPEPMGTFIDAVKPLMASSNLQTQEQVVLTIYAAHGKTNSELLVSTLLKMAVDKETDKNTLHAAAISLGKIAQYAAPELKKRVKKILNSQCIATRDPVVCKEFTALE
ncbi:MAG: HEAT repeat domain-containing protein [Candidatus Lokiarchaeota archaeon]|nr:HEAT repeat domain-containing protein [Candidatus Lokiarchaeota archaeon]